VFRQGEILADVIQIQIGADSLASDTSDISIEEVVHPYALILTQDCDLDWDFKARASVKSQQDGGTQDQREENRRQAKLVPNVLLCELTTAESLRPRLAGSDVLRRIRANQDERYHCFAAIPDDSDSRREGLPELVADFKRVFSIPTEELYLRLRGGTNRRSTLQSPFLQHLSTRFGYFCLRVALPEPIELPTAPPSGLALPQLPEPDKPVA
jgi:hypothetical protein